MTYTIRKVSRRSELTIGTTDHIHHQCRVAQQMTRKALIKEAELRRMAKLAKQFGVVVEQEVDGVIIRIRPFHGDVPDAEEYPKNLTEWRAGKIEPAFGRAKGNSSGKQVGGNRTAPALSDGHSNIETGPGGFPIDDDPNGPLKEYYDRLGFDPRTMTSEDMRRLREKADAEWRAAVPATALWKREKDLLRQLAAFGANVPIDPSQIQRPGHEAPLRLTIRGFIEQHFHDDRPGLTEWFLVTDDGYAAAKRENLIGSGKDSPSE